MTEEEIRQALALCEEATAGPWEALPFTRREGEVVQPWRIFLRGHYNFMTNSRDCDWTEKDAAFIAAARDLLPRALLALQEARADKEGAAWWGAACAKVSSELAEARAALAEERDVGRARDNALSSVMRERDRARAENEGLRAALVACKNLTRHQEWAPKGEVGELGRMVGDVVDKALARSKEDA